MCMNERKTPLSIVKNTVRSSSSVTPEVGVRYPHQKWNVKLWRSRGGWVRIRLPSVPLCLSGPFPEQPTYVREEERHPPCEQEPVPAPNMQGLVLRVVVMHPPCEREAAHAPSSC